MKKMLINLGMVSSLVFGVGMAHAANEGSETMSKGIKQNDYYKTYETKGDDQITVNSAKDAAEPGKVLNQDRLKIKLREPKGGSSGRSAGQGGPF